MASWRLLQRRKFSWVIINHKILATQTFLRTKYFSTKIFHTTVYAMLCISVPYNILFSWLYICSHSTFKHSLVYCFFTILYKSLSKIVFLHYLVQIFCARHGMVSFHCYSFFLLPWRRIILTPVGSLLMTFVYCWTLNIELPWTTFIRFDHYLWLAVKQRGRLGSNQAECETGVSVSSGLLTGGFFNSLWPPFAPQRQSKLLHFDLFLSIQA